MIERNMQIDQIRERLEREEYDVDPGAVAAAIVARLLGDQASPRARR